MRDKNVLGSGNNQGKTTSETRIKQQAPVKAEADRGDAISPRQENKTVAETRMKKQAPIKTEANQGAAMNPGREGKTGTDTHMKGEMSGGHDSDGGAPKTMSNHGMSRKSAPAAEAGSGKGTHEKVQ